MDIFETIAERKIREAMEGGMFENLSGEGRPLVLEDETWIPGDLRAAYRFLRNSGYVPPEIELRSEIINLKKLIDTLDDNKERLRKLRELNFKIINLNILRKKPLSLEAEDRLLGKMIS